MPTEVSIYAPCVDCGCYPCACPQDTLCSVCNRKVCNCAQIEINGLGGYRFTNQCLTCYTTPCVCPRDYQDSGSISTCSKCYMYPCMCEPTVTAQYICSKCGAMSCLCNLAAPVLGPHDRWQHRSVNMRCWSCMWWVPKMNKDYEEGEVMLGRCRKHAPKLDGWPAVYGDDWCGDHKLDEEKV